jgi:hypothetical protein
VLGLSLPDGIQVTTRVLRRSEQAPAHDRIETSEFMQQVFDDGRVGECTFFVLEERRGHAWHCCYC